jgi:hypothetical protein
MDPVTAFDTISLGIRVCNQVIAYAQAQIDFRERMGQLRDNASDVKQLLQRLRSSTEGEPLDAKQKDALEQEMRSCERTVHQMQDVISSLQSKPGHRLPAAVRRATWPLSHRVEELEDQLEKLKQTLHRVVATITMDMSLKNRMQQMQDWLEAPKMWEQHSLVCETGEIDTCAWFLRSNAYIDWASGKKRHLWLRGASGCGKTVLASRVIEELRKRHDGHRGCSIAFVYFTFADTKKHNLSAFLRTLTSQLSIHSSSIRDGMQKIQKPSGSSFTSPEGPSDSELEKLLGDSFRAARERNEPDHLQHIYVVLDGLDECPHKPGDASRQRICQSIQRLAKAHTNLRCLVASQHTYDIQALMRDLSAEEIEVRSEDTQRDMKAYFEARLASPDFHRFGAASKKLIIDRLTAGADGMYA